MTTGHRRFRWVGIALAIMSCTAMMSGASPASDAAQLQSSDINELRALLAAQQKQIEQLRTALEEQKKVVDNILGYHCGPSLGQSEACISLKNLT